MFSSLELFFYLFIYRYLRLIVNLYAFIRFRPIQPPEDPKLSPQDVTVILPSLEGDGAGLVETLRTILNTEPFEIILVTIDSKRQRAEKMVQSMGTKRIKVCSVANPNKRRQMVRAIPEVKTKITIFADDDVSWPPKVLKWILAVFEIDKYGGCATCQRLRRRERMDTTQWVWGYLCALYLERRNFDCAATTYMDGGVSCLSGRTVAYRTCIIQDPAFTHGFQNEQWFGRYQLNADDDNFMTRWMVSHGWETYIQYHPECEVQTTLEDNPKFLRQCARWARSNWRSNITSMFVERYIWRQQPYSTYAVHLTTLSPPAFIGDALLVWLCHCAFRGYNDRGDNTYWIAMGSLLTWMFVSKFIKLLGHYIRYPVDCFLLPVSILFGWFHGGIKVFAALTLNVTTWGSRPEADTDDALRLIKLDDQRRQKLLGLNDPLCEKDPDEFIAQHIESFAIKKQLRKPRFCPQLLFHKPESLLADTYCMVSR